jgi:hypothetical protein
MAATLAMVALVVQAATVQLDSEVLAVPAATVAMLAMLGMAVLVLMAMRPHPMAAMAATAATLAWPGSVALAVPAAARLRLVLMALRDSRSPAAATAATEVPASTRWPAAGLLVATEAAAATVDLLATAATAAMAGTVPTEPMGSAPSPPDPTGAWDKLVVLAATAALAATVVRFPEMAEMVASVAPAATVAMVRRALLEPMEFFQGLTAVPAAMVATAGLVPLVEMAVLAD